MPLRADTANIQIPSGYASDRPISDRKILVTSRPSRGTLPRQFEVAVALQQCSLAAAGSMAAGLRSAGASEISLAVCRGSSRIFRGTIDQIAAVRRFVRSEFGEHLALDDAVLVASELATNAVVHTASGQASGMFLVHLAIVSTDHVAILITDQGSANRPCARRPETDKESGRGLIVVAELAALLVSYGDATVRSMLAVIGGKSSHEPKAEQAQIALASQAGQKDGFMQSTGTHRFCQGAERQKREVIVVSPASGKWLRDQRRARGWGVREMRRKLREVAAEAGDKLPANDSLTVMIYRWEDDRSGISERYRLYYCRAFQIPIENFGYPAIAVAIQQASAA